MPTELPPPYERSALEPHVSALTVDHHRLRQRLHVEQVEALVAGTGLADLSLTQLMAQAQGALFQHAAMASSIDFYWRCLRPVGAGGGGDPTGRLAELLVRRFREVARFRDRFTEAALALPGSGWVWLVQRRDGQLSIVSTGNAGTPLTGDDAPLLACSVWEHAYYLDHHAARDAYLAAFWQVVDWEFVASQLR